MSFLSQLRERLHALLFRTREEQDLAEELRAHIEMETEANLRRGMSRDEARRQALIAFGGVERFKEEVRDARNFGILEDLAQDLRYAARRLTREPGFSVPVIATLALGIGVTAAVFGLANAVLIRPLPYPEADRLVVIRHTASKIDLPMTGLSAGLAEYYRANSRVFENIGVYIERVSTLTDLDQPERVHLATVRPGVFSALQPRMSLGRLPVADDYAPPPDNAGGIVRAAVISHALWMRRYGGDSSVVGRTIELNGNQTGPVVGVTEPGFHFPHPDTHVWLALGWSTFQSVYALLDGLQYENVARLRAGVSKDDSQRDLDRLVRAIPDAFPEVSARDLDEMGLGAVAVPLKREIIGSVRDAVLLLLAAAAFLLAISWANATNLTLIRAERMRREVAVARALGAGDGHLASRFLVEGLVLAALGGTLALGLAALAIDFRFGFAPDDIPRLRDVRADAGVLGVGVALTLVSAVLLGLTALVSARRPPLASMLTGALSRMTAGRREQMGRRLLVAGQVALALTLLIGSALMAQSFWRLKQVRLGFEPADALAFRLDLAPVRGRPSDYYGIVRIHEAILDGIRALPGVEAAEAASASGFPLTPVPSNYTFRLAAVDRPEPRSGWPYGQLSAATPGYFRTMGIRLVRGRTFQPEDASPERGAFILSASLASALFGDEDPIGRRVRYANGSREHPVVGVAGDVPSESIRDGPSRVFYVPNSTSGAHTVYIPEDVFYVVRTGLPLASLVPAIQQRIREVDSRLLITQVGTLDKLVADSMARARLTMLLLVVASATALALGVIGIYGILSYAVGRRINELGIRIALGQTPAGVVRMVVRQGVRLALAGVAVGFIAAFALTRYLRALLYEVSPSDPAAFVSMAALLLAVAFAASYLPARRAGRIDPVRALRAD